MPTMRQKQKAPLTQKLEALTTKPILSDPTQTFQFSLRDICYCFIGAAGLYLFTLLMLIAGA